LKDRLEDPLVAGCDLNSHLEETKWEFIMWLTSDPESEIFVDFLIFWIEDGLHLSHEFKTQVAVVEDNPLTSSHTGVDKIGSWNFHFFSHGDLTSWELLLLLGILINGTSWICTLGEQIQDWDVDSGLFEDLEDLISDWLDELLTEDISDEHVTGKYCSILSHGSDKAEMDEVSDVLVGADLLLVVWDWSLLWLVLINPLSPDLIVSSDSVWELLEEEGVVISELVLGQGFKVEPSLLLHPLEWLASVIDTTTGFKEETYIGWGESTILNEDLGGHHEFEGDLISLEEASVNVSVGSSSEPVDNNLNCP
jgi:hypothetical protein